MPLRLAAPASERLPRTLAKRSHGRGIGGLVGRFRHVDDRKRKTSTLARRLAAISQVHQAAGYPTPTAESVVRSVLAGIRRVHGSEQTAKTALSPELLRQLVAGIPDTLRGRRDRALLLVGFAGALRRSELVALERRLPCPVRRQNA